MSWAGCGLSDLRQSASNASRSFALHSHNTRLFVSSPRFTSASNGCAKRFASFAGMDFATYSYVRRQSASASSRDDAARYQTRRHKCHRCNAAEECLTFAKHEKSISHLTNVWQKIKVLIAETDGAGRRATRTPYRRKLAGTPQEMVSYPTPHAKVLAAESECRMDSCFGTNQGV